MSDNTLNEQFKPLFNSISDFLEDHNEKFPEKDAIIHVDLDRHKENRISYKKLLKLTNKTANFFFQQGITKGDRIALMMHNTLDTIILELAAGLIGASSVPLDLKRDTLERKIFKLNDTNAKLVFVRTDEEGTEKDIKSIKKTLPSEFVLLEDTHSLENLVGNQPENIMFSVNDSLENEYVILYTSGTTSNPKGVSLSIRAFFANAEGIIKWQRLSSSDIFNIVLPLHHVNSTTFCLATLLVGGTIVLNSRYSASKFWKIISKYKATITSIVPTILHDLLVRKEEYFTKKYDLSSLKGILIGSAPVLPEETLRFCDTFKVDVIQGYGQTETALRVTGVPIDLEKEMYRDIVRMNSIGVELSNCNVTILKDGKETKENEEGEICVRGPVLANGYLNDIGETNKIFSDGWFHSGDLGYYKMIDGKKYFFIKGRIKEIIIKGGINISPVAIEDALLKSFPEIDQACVVGYPDSRMGEDVASLIYFKQDCSEQRRKEILYQIIQDGRLGKLGISRYEAPQKVFEVKEYLPKTSTGKIKRAEVKEMVNELIKTERTKHYYCRLIDTNEEDILSKAVEINNKRWNIKSAFSEFKERAKNGYLIGVFDEEENLCGTLSALQIAEEKLTNISTWNELTGNGTLNTNDVNGNILLCVTISINGEDITNNILSSENLMVNSLLKDEWEKNSQYKDIIENLAKSVIENYIETNLDNVIRFHRKPKGGLSKGGEVIKIFPNSRIEDKDSLGFNVLIEYREINEQTEIIKSKSSPSVLLMEHAFSLAKEKNCKVAAYSRPAQLKLHLAKALDNSLKFNVKDESEFLSFSKFVQEKLAL